MGDQQRAALVVDGVVENVIVVDSRVDYTPVTGDVVVLPDNLGVGSGWTYDGVTFTAPPRRDLTVDTDLIPADGTTAAGVTYADTHDDAPSSVVFTANGATKTVNLTSAGNAFLDIVSSTPGDTVTVTVDALPDARVIITVEG